MKSIKIFFSALFLFSIAFVGCNKYQDGPKFSLLTKKARLCGIWTLEKYTFNGSDQTSIFSTLMGSSAVMEIEKSGSYKITGANPGFNDDGKWKLGEDKDDVLFTSSQAGSTEKSYRILRLKSKELWVKFTETNGDIDEYHYKAK